MGLVVDTSVFIFAERRSSSVRGLLSLLAETYPDEDLILSVVTATEIIHGIFRAKDEQMAEVRERFAREIFRVLPPLPFTQENAWTAGRLRGEQMALGNTLPLADSLIAATAMDLNYGVLTRNTADFARVPGLRVVPHGT